jgi:hypothetical protein
VRGDGMVPPMARSRHRRSLTSRRTPQPFLSLEALGSTRAQRVSFTSVPFRRPKKFSRSIWRTERV